jgi:hypothetical protein
MAAIHIMLPSDAFFFLSFAQTTISILTIDFEDLNISDIC